MTLAEFLAVVVKQLDDALIEYMIAGSVASSIHGEPRTTRDIDIVIEVTEASLRALFSSLDRNAIYVDEQQSEQQGVAAGDMFNLLDMHGGWKVDLIVRKARSFSKVEFARRRRADVFGVSVMVATAEDVVLSKLEWAARSGSSRQVDDARGIVAVQGWALDREYLRLWAAELGVSELLAGILAESV